MLAACSEEIQSAETQSELNYQNYLYGGKELDRKFGINAYDFTGRYYDLTDNRFWSMDPMAEKNYDVSPYAYCKNNPIIRTDPSGMLDISKTTREEFPEFSEFIDNISSVYRNNGEVFQSALKETSSLNDSEINDALKKDNGPEELSHNKQNRLLYLLLRYTFGNMSYKIPDLPLSFDVETKAVLKQTIESNRRLAELKGVVKSMPNASILINTLALQEAKDSSAIESIITTHDELYKAELFVQQFTSAGAKEVQTYADALKKGFEMVSKKQLLTNNAIIEIFRNVKQNDSGFRVTPGTTLKNERTQEIVYEPPQSIDLIQNYMSNLEKFINDESISDLDPLVKMAIIHHQFESIHPFSDGNGRTGRIINILYLVQQGLLDLPVLYLSRYVIKNKGKYYELLQKVRDEHAWEEWILFMLKGIELTAIETINLVEGVKKLMAQFKKDIRDNLSKIYSQDLLNNLFRHPYTRIEFVMNELSVSRPTASSYLKQLEARGLVVKLKLGRENFYLNEKLFDLLINAFHLETEVLDSIDSNG